MPLKVAAAISVVGLILAIASVVYGYSSPDVEPEKTTERITAATRRHSQVVALEQAVNRGDEKETEAARKKFEEARRVNDELIAARNKAIARHGFITGMLRYSGCICMLVAPLTYLAKSQST